MEIMQGPSERSAQAGITASTTQTQGQQTLAADVNQVSTVANNDDVVTLPAAFPGEEITIINDGLNTLQIFPATGDDLGTGLIKVGLRVVQGGVQGAQPGL